MRFILASSSPRRLFLLSQAGFTPHVFPAEITETRLPEEPAIEYARRMALSKARVVSVLQQNDRVSVLQQNDRVSVLQQNDSALVLGADTVVHLENELFVKPKDQNEAAQTLRRLSGDWHQVTTAFAVLGAGDSTLVRSVTTRVCFRQLSDGDIERYIATGESLDKAGAYGIQGKGGALIDRVEGSYTNVVGLPLPEVLTELQAAGLSPDQ